MSSSGSDKRRYEKCLQVWGNAKSANAAQPKQGTVVIFMSPHHSESVYNVDTFKENFYGSRHP